MANQLQRSALVVSALLVWGVQAAWAEERSPLPLKKGDLGGSKTQGKTQISRIRDQLKPAKTIKDWLAQVEAATVQVTNVNVQRTDTGLDITLETAEGKPLQVDATKFRSEGNSLIADLANAVLALPERQEFSTDNPTNEIANVRITQLNASTIRIIVVGKTALPTEEVTLKTGALAYSLNPEAEEPDEEIVVTGEAQRGYRAPNASTATKTDTPLRDIPQSIQVIPQQVIQDQGALRLIDVLRNVAGVSVTGSSPRTFADGIFTIRGFSSANNILRDGLLDDTIRSVGFEAAGIERVEVLKGPASVLYGQGPIGGTVNLVTKQPLRDPFYQVKGSVGSFNFYRGAIDLSGPLNSDRTVLYRLNAAARTTESFVDFYEQQRYFVTPALTWLISDRTKLTLSAEYQQVKGPFDFGIPAEGSVLPNPNGKIPRDRFIAEPARDDSDNRVFRVGYDLEHRFSENWQVRSAFRASFLQLDREINFSSALAANKRTLTRANNRQDYNDDVYNLDNYIVGKFATGSIKHQLVTGFNLYRQDSSDIDITRAIAPLDLFNPQYGASPTGPSTISTDIKNRTQLFGLYVQDQITLAENLKLLLGGRFDIANQKFENLLRSTTDFQQNEVFSPRVGIVYQPIPAISLYASYNRSFQQVTSVFSAAPPQPERGTQYEVGVKAELGKRIAATLAFYDLTRSNVPTPDPNNPLRSIQVGEQRSRGIEFDISGEILPGWNIIAGYALTDAEITKDNTFAVGNLLNNVPRNSFNLWTTYEIKSGRLKGLGIGLGFFYFGDRQGDLANTFELPSYFRTDAAIYYKRSQFRAGLNFKNLFNIDYFESAQNRNRVFYGDPFTVQGTISWEF